MNRKLVRMFSAALVATASQVMALSLVSGCAFAGETLATRSRYLMGTTCEVTLPRRELPAVETVFAEIDRIERLMSTWRSDSELSRLNASAGSMRVSRELVETLARAIDLSELTGGAFNPAVGPLLDLWRTREEGAVPHAAAVAAVLPRLALAPVDVNRDDASIALNGRVIEEGAFAKGYALDRAVEALRRRGVRNALINFGGQVSVMDTPREVAVAHPLQRDEAIITFVVANKSVSTSAGTEKTFVVNGRTFTHIFDPRTGEALEPRGSVSVVADSGFEADALSTALYVMGPDEALQWAERHGVAALFIVPQASRLAVSKTSFFDRAASELAALHPQVIFSKGNS